MRIRDATTSRAGGGEVQPTTTYDRKAVAWLANRVCRRCVPEIDRARRAKIVVTMLRGEALATYAKRNALGLRLTPYGKIRRAVVGADGRVRTEWTFLPPLRTVDVAAALLVEFRNMVGLETKPFEARFAWATDRLGEYLPLVPRKALSPRPQSLDEARRHNLLRRIQFHSRRRARSTALLKKYAAMLTEGGRR